MLDKSVSMLARKTYDGRMKWEHLVDVVTSLLGRFERSRMAAAFKVSFIWYNDTASPVVSQGNYYYDVVPLNRALEVFKLSLEENHPYGYTSFVDAFSALREVVERYVRDLSIPSEKYVTVFLLSDGRESKVSRDKAYAEAKYTLSLLGEELRSLNERNSISIATIALGVDADRDYLRAVASYLKEVQRRVLKEHGLLDLVDPPFHEKMFLEAPLEGIITKEWIEAARRFVERLSETAIV